MRLLTSAVVALSLVTVACDDSSSGSSNGSTPTGPSNGSTLNVQITDSPFSDAAAVLVTFSEVAVHRADGRWSTVPFANGSSSRTCDLKKLQGAQDVLGVGSLSPAHYTQIRLGVARATLYFANASAGPACATTISPPGGPSAPVEIPSGEVKLNRQFELTANDAMTVLLDFDGGKSIRETGNGRFKMTPVIGIVSVQ